MPEPRCWVVTEGHVGMVNQALGLAEAVGIAHQVKAVRLRFPWTHLKPSLMAPPLSAVAPGSDPLAPPWPALMITCGRRSTGLSIAVKKASGGATRTVHIQDPLVDPANFDLVVIPAHDRVRGLDGAANVLVSRMALHRVTDRRLAEAGARFAGTYSGLPRPRVAVLIGGANRRYRLTPAVARDIAGKLARLARETGAGLMITASRRTGAGTVAILRAGLDGVAAEIWDGDGDNPYFGLLALADAIVVTCDSVSMVSEACATGKPVYVIDLQGGSRRFDAFHRGLREAGITRPFDGTLAQWSYEAPDDTARIGAELRRMMGLDAALPIRETAL